MNLELEKFQRQFWKADSEYFSMVTILPLLIAVFLWFNCYEADLFCPNLFDQPTYIFYDFMARKIFKTVLES